MSFFLFLEEQKFVKDTSKSLLRIEVKKELKNLINCLFFKFKWE